MVRYDLPSFSHPHYDGTSGDDPFVNLLTVTRNDFANFAHQDNDFVPLAFGMWWASQVRNREVFDLEGASHANIPGGAFCWVEYGVAVDFHK